MKRNDYFKKGGLIVLSASYLLSNAGTVLAEDYKLNNSVQVYREAQEAKNRAKTNKTWPKGSYHIYKKFDGMLNITRDKNTPGGWINPADNISVPNLPNSDNSSETFVLKTEVNVYIDSDDAKSKTNPVTSYKPGEYSVYKSYNGMLNITKVPGEAGGWINPADVNISLDLEEQNKFVLIAETDGYIDSYDAKDKKNSIMNVSKGEYFIYKKYNGMINITKDDSTAGVWINPELTQKENNTKEIITINNNNEDKQENVTYRLKTVTNGYMNSDDAKRKVNPVRKVEQGVYYIFKTFNGMLNLSNTTNEAGIWINPIDNFVYTQKNQINKVTEVNKEDKENLSFDKAVDKFIDNKITEKELEELEYSPEEITKTAIEKIANSSKDDVVKVKVSDMETVKETEVETEKETEVETVKETEVETAKETEVETIEETKVETVEETEVETAKETEVETVKETEVETIEETEVETAKETEVETVEETEAETTKEKENKEHVFDKNTDLFFSQEYELKEKANGYLSVEDALSTKNSITILSNGKYFIYQEDESMINITTVKGKPGLWINPQKLFVDELIEQKIKVGQSYNLDKEVNGYNRATDAINELNPSTKVAPGDYIVYQIVSGVVNLSKDPNQPGVWVNLN